MKKVCLFSMVLLLSLSLTSCVVTDYANKVMDFFNFNKKTEKPVEAPSPEIPATDSSKDSSLSPVEETENKIAETQPVKEEIIPEPVIEEIVVPEPEKIVELEPQPETIAKIDPEPEPIVEPIIEPVVEPEPIVEPEPETEPEIPANILFAEKLKELLAKNDIKGAIAAFDESKSKPKESYLIIPEESLSFEPSASGLESAEFKEDDSSIAVELDEELSMLLASLLLSNGDYERAKKVANDVLKINPKNVDGIPRLLLFLSF